jgi:hypothetical protein
MNLHIPVAALLVLTACAHAGPGFSRSELDQQPTKVQTGRCPGEPESDFGTGWQYVWLDFVLTEEGVADAVVVRRGPRISVDEAAEAEAALRTCRYRPGLVAGRPVRVLDMTTRVRVPRSAPQVRMPVDTVVEAESGTSLP